MRANCYVPFCIPTFSCCMVQTYSFVWLKTFNLVYSVVTYVPAYATSGLIVSLQPAFYPTEAEDKGATPSQVNPENHLVPVIILTQQIPNYYVSFLPVKDWGLCTTWKAISSLLCSLFRQASSLSTLCRPHCPPLCLTLFLNSVTSLLSIFANDPKLVSSASNEKSRIQLQKKHQCSTGMGWKCASMPQNMQ